MRFVEAVAGEGDDHVPEFLGQFLVDAVFLSASQVPVVVPGDDLFLLLTNRLNTLIRTGQRNITDTVQNPHHLFLVNHHAVGFFENLVHDGMNLPRLLPTVLHLDVFHDHAAFQRPRSIQSRRRDDVFELVRLHLGQQVANTARLELEDAFRLTALQ